MIHRYMMYIVHFCSIHWTQVLVYYHYLYAPCQLFVLSMQDPDGVSSPVRRELHLGILTGHQLRDEGEVWDLCGRPTKLEDDDEGSEVNDLCPLGGVVGTGQAGDENEGERHKNANGPWKAERELLRKGPFNPCRIACYIIVLWCTSPLSEH